MAAIDDELAGGELRAMQLLGKLRRAVSEAEASQLSAQARAEIQRLATLADELEDAAGALDDDSAALVSVARHRSEHARLQLALRDALLDARRAIRAHDEHRRAALLAGGSAQIDRTAVQSAAEVTETLRRTRRLMAEEVARSEAALSNLHATGGTLRGVLDEHGAIAGSLAAGARTTSRIKRREATDRALTLVGFAFFLAVVAHIVARRLVPLARPLLGASTPPAPAPTPAPPERQSPLEPADGARAAPRAPSPADGEAWRDGDGGGRDASPDGARSCAVDGGDGLQEAGRCGAPEPSRADRGRDGRQGGLQLEQPHTPT
ncbi:hypothetical protein KFE25_011895 [Diacronema lutheri]|uniref:Sec20 C-terminal domain-containing protein n=1 Tax=Diacronema lutheri TaxID=2081491 RepID=A0A8J6C4P9_DIALT|nr:hypothetical protein KFE25_011895 [Diacronema lutheri]